MGGIPEGDGEGSVRLLHPGEHAAVHEPPDDATSSTNSTMAQLIMSQVHLPEALFQARKCRGGHGEVLRAGASEGAMLT